MGQESKVAWIMASSTLLAAALSAGATIVAARSGSLPSGILPSPSVSTVSVTVTGPAVTQTATVTKTVDGAGDSSGPSTGQTAGVSQTLLTDLDAIAGNPESGSASLSGTTYPNSVETQVGGCERKGTIKYDTSQLHGRFTTRVGLDSHSDSDTVVIFSFYVDGRPISLGANKTSIQATKFSSTPVAFTLTGVELEMRWNFVKGDMGLCSNAGSAVWGDPAIAVSQ